MTAAWIWLRLPGWRPLLALRKCRTFAPEDLRRLQDPFWGHGKGGVWAARRALYERTALWGGRP